MSSFTVGQNIKLLDSTLVRVVEVIDANTLLVGEVKRGVVFDPYEVDIESDIIGKPAIETVKAGMTFREFEAFLKDEKFAAARSWEAEKRMESLMLGEV